MASPTKMCYRSAAGAAHTHNSYWNMSWREVWVPAKMVGDEQGLPWMSDILMS